MFLIFTKLLVSEIAFYYSVIVIKVCCYPFVLNLRR